LEADMPRAGLVVVDMQNAFCHPDGKIFVPEAQQQLPALAECLHRARQADMPVIFTTVLWPSVDAMPLGLRMTDPKWEQGWNDPGSPALGQWGAEITPELAPLDEELVLDKAGFLCPGLGEAARERDLNPVYLTGTTANNCVYAAALSLFEAGIEVRAITDCISGFGEPMKTPWLQNIAMFMGSVVSIDDFKADTDAAIALA
jgi:nicotinamidase-related amidase